MNGGRSKWLNGGGGCGSEWVYRCGGCENE